MRGRARSANRKALPQYLRQYPENDDLVSAGYALEVLKRKWKNYVGFTQIHCFNLQSDRNFEHLYEPAALFSLRKHC
jgi:hypothetical protein